MRPRELFVLLLILFGSFAALHTINSPTGAVAIQWVDRTEFYLSPGVALTLNLDESFSTSSPLRFTIAEQPELYVVLDGSNLIVAPSPGAIGEYPLIVKASDGASTIEQTLTFIVKSNEPSKPAVQVKEPPAPKVQELPKQPDVPEQKETFVLDSSGRKVGEKIEDEPDYETYITFAGIEGNNFVVKLYHDASEPLPVWVEGAEAQPQFAASRSEITVAVPLVVGTIPAFKLHVGKESEVFAFGSSFSPSAITTCTNVSGSDILANNVSAGACMNITGSSIVLDCAGFTIHYGNEGSGGFGISVDLAHDVAIKNCIIVSHNATGRNDGIRVQRSNNTRIENSTILLDGLTGAGIRVFSGVRNVTIVNNTIYAKGTSAANIGIDVDGNALAFSTVIHNAAIENNTITTDGTNNNYGIQLSMANYSVVRNNHIAINGTGSGNIGVNVVYGSNDSIIIDNTIITNGSSSNTGVMLTASSRNNITNNTISTNGAAGSNYGIYISAGFGLLNDAAIFNNTIVTNGAGSNIGVRFEGSVQNSTLYNNSILTRGTAESNFGIQLIAAADANLTGNNIANNTVNTSGTAHNHGIVIEGSASNNAFNYTNITTSGGSASFGMSIAGGNNTFSNVYLFDPVQWIDASMASQSNFTNLTFATGNGSIRFYGDVQVNATRNITRTHLNIVFNNAFVNESNLFFLNTSAQIMFRGLTFTNPKPVANTTNSSAFADCSAAICTENSYEEGVFVFNVSHFTAYSSFDISSIDITMPKDTINCTATVFQDFDSVTLYTCGDNASIGGTIECDYNGTDSSLTMPTNATNCDVNNSNFGAFLIINNGTNATLNATVVNITIGGVNTTNVSLDNYIYDAVSTPGCNGTSCNNCPAADTLGCFKDLDNGTATPDTVQECDNFVAGGALCQCFSIHIDDPDVIHEMKNGKQLQFQVKKSVSSPASDPCP